MLQKYFERPHYSASDMCSITPATRSHPLDPHEEINATLAAEPFCVVLVNTAANPTRDRSAQVIVRDRCATDAEISNILPPIGSPTLLVVTFRTGLLKPITLLRSRCLRL